MTAHTPAPWRYEDGSVYGGDLHRDLRLIVALPTLPRNVDKPDPEIFSEAWIALDETETANALLIAAAPELEAAVEHADGCFEAALAEGWVDALANGDIEAIRDLWLRRLSCARDYFPAAIAKAKGKPNATI